MRAKPEEIVSVLREEIQNYDTRVRRDETGTVLEAVSYTHLTLPTT